MRFLAGFTTSYSAISRTIRLATRGHVSHAYVVFDDIPIVGHIAFEAAWCGWRETTRTKVGGSQIELPVDVKVEAAFAQSRDWLNVPYDYAGLFGEAPVMLGRVLGNQKWPNPFAGPHHMFCSEASTLLIQKFARVPSGLENLDARTVDPSYEMESLVLMMRKQSGALSSVARPS